MIVNTTIVSTLSALQADNHSLRAELTDARQAASNGSGREGAERARFADLDSELADAESVYVAVDALRELGLSSDDVVVRYSSRAVLSEVLGWSAAFLSAVGIAVIQPLISMAREAAILRIMWTIIPMWTMESPG